MTRDHQLVACRWFALAFPWDVPRCFAYLINSEACSITSAVATVASRSAAEALPTLVTASKPSLPESYSLSWSQCAFGLKELSVS